MARTRVILDPVAIQSLWVPGGEVYKKAMDVRDDIQAAARRRVRNRSRGLWRSISSSRHTLPLGVSFKVFAYSHYAYWVEEGTRARITATGANYMVLYQGDRFVPARWAGTVGHYRAVVNGQTGRHYLRNGLVAGLAKHRLGPGV